MDWARAQVVKVMNFSGSELNVFQPLSDQFMSILWNLKSQIATMKVTMIINMKSISNVSENVF